MLLLGVLSGCDKQGGEGSIPQTSAALTPDLRNGERYAQGLPIQVPQPLQDGTATIEQAREWACSLLVLLEGGRIVVQERELVPGGEPALFISNPSNAGTGGNQHMVFVKTLEGLRYAGSLHFGDCRAVDPDHGGRPRLVTYWHMSSSEGQLTLWRLGDEDFQWLHTVTIHPGDGGTDEGRAIYSAFLGSDPVDESLVQVTFPVTPATSSPAEKGLPNH